MAQQKHILNSNDGRVLFKCLIIALWKSCSGYNASVAYSTAYLLICRYTIKYVIYLHIIGHVCIMYTGMIYHTWYCILCMKTATPVNVYNISVYDSLKSDPYLRGIARRVVVGPDFRSGSSMTPKSRLLRTAATTWQSAQSLFTRCSSRLDLLSFSFMSRNSRVIPWDEHKIIFRKMQIM